MDKKLSRFIGIIVAILLVLNIAASESYAQNPAEKLKRGLINTLTGWVELPKNIYDTSVEDGRLSGLTVGFAKGVAMTVVRTGAGLYEMVSFMFPIPEGYKPVLEPESVFTTEY